MTRADANPFAAVVASGFAPRAVLGEFRLVQEHMVGQLAISRDNKWAVTDTGGRNAEVLYVWNLETGDLAWRMEDAHQNCFVFHPDGKHLLVYDRASHGLHARALATGRSSGVTKLPKRTETVSQLRASADGTRVLVGHGLVVDTRTGKRVAHIERFAGSYFPSYLSPRGNVVVSGQDDDSLWCHDVRTNKTTRLDAPDDHPYGFAMTADEDVLVTRGFGHTRVYHLAGGKARLVSNTDGDPIFPNVCAMSSNQRVALSCDGQRVEVVALSTFEVEAKLPIDRVHALAFLDDDRLLVARYGDIINYYDSAILETWRISSGERLDAHRGHRAGVLALAAAGDVLCSTGIDGSVRMWSLPDGAEAEMFEFDGDRPEHLEVDERLSRIFVTASSDHGGHGIVYDAKTLAAVQDVGRGTTAMSRDGTKIARVTYGHPLHILDAENDELARATPMKEYAYALAWSPDSQRVLARTRNQFRIYDTTCNQLLEHTGEITIYDAALLADGVVWVDESGLHLTRGEDTITRGGTYYKNYWHHAVIAASHDGASLAVTDGEQIWCFDTTTLADRGSITLGEPRYRILSLAYSGDDRQLFAGTSLGPILAFTVL